MADKADGSIRIPVGLDTPEMKEDTNVCNELLKSLVRTATAASKAIRGTFQNLGPKKPVQIEAEVKDPTKDDRQGRPTEAYRQLQEDIDITAAKVVRLRDELKKMQDENGAAVKETPFFKREQQELEKALAEQTRLYEEKAQMEQAGMAYQNPEAAAEPIMIENRALREAQRTAESLTAEIGKLNRASEQGFRNPESVLRFSDNIAQAEQRIADAKTMLAELAAQNIPTDDYAGLTQAIEQSDQALAKLYLKREQLRKSGLGEESAKWQALAEQIAQAEQEASYLAEKQAEMEANGSAFIKPESTAQFQELGQAIAQAENRLETSRGLIQQEEIEQARLNVLAAQETVATARTAEEREKALAQLQQSQNELTRVAGQSVTPKPDADALQGWDAFKAKVGDAATAVAKAFGTGAKNLFSGLKNALKSVGQGFKNLVGKAKGAASGTNGLVKALTSMKTLLIGRVKRAFISKITSDVAEGIKALAKYDSAVDRSMSNLRNSSKEIGTNLSVTLGQLITAIEPIVTKALDAITATVTKINALFAMLRGQTTVTVAKKQTESYAASLDGTASSAKKATEAQKKLNRQLMGFDQLNKLSAPSDADKAGANTGSDLFETKPIASVLKGIPAGLLDTIKKVKDAIKRGDFFGAGAAIGDGLNSIVGAFNDFIDKVRPRAKAAAQALGEGISGFLSTVDMRQIGGTLANGLNLIIETMHSFITAIDWTTAGRRFADGINGFLLGIDWQEVARTIADGFNGLVDFLFETFTTIDWAGIAQSLADGVSTLVREIDWGKAGQTISKGAEGLLRFIVTLIERTDWAAVGKAVADIITGINWGSLIGLIIEGLSAVIAGAVQLLAGLGARIITAIWEGIKKYGKSIGWDLEGKNIIEGLLGGILLGLASIGQWIIDHIFKPIWNGIKRAFGIASPSKETEKLGKYIIEGLLQGILSGLGAILDFFKGLVAAIGKVLTAAWNGITAATTAAWNGIKSATTTVWNGITGFLSSAWNGIKNAASTAWSGIKSTVTGAVSSIRSGIENSSLYQAGAKLMNSAKEGITNAWDSVKTTLGNLWDGLGSWLTNTRKGLTEAGSNLVQGLKNGIQKGWDTVKGAVSSVWDKVTETAQKVFDEHSPSKVFEQIGAYLDEGLVQGIKKGQTGVLNTTARLAQAVTDDMSTTLKPSIEIEAQTDDIQSRITGMAGAFDRLVQKLAAIADAFAGVQLAIPELATGAAIPPRTRITEPAYGRPAAAVAEDGAIERKLTELLTLLTDQQGRSREITINVPLQLDRNELGKAVARYNLSGQRQTNGGLR